MKMVYTTPHWVKLSLAGCLKNKKPLDGWLLVLLRSCPHFTGGQGADPESKHATPRMDISDISGFAASPML